MPSLNVRRRALIGDVAFGGPVLGFSRDPRRQKDQYGALLNRRAGRSYHPPPVRYAWVVRRRLALRAPRLFPTPRRR